MKNHYWREYSSLGGGKLHIERKEDMDIYFSYKRFVDDLVYYLFEEEINNMISNYIRDENNFVQKKGMFFCE